MPRTTDLLLEWDRRRPRTQQVEIGPSDLGSCRRRVGYKLAGTKPVNAQGSVQAAMGSSIHDAVRDILADLGLEHTAEQKVAFAGISGSYDRTEDDDTLLVDLKTTSSRWLEHIILHGPDHSHIWQTSFYAAALRQAGKPIERIRIDYLARDTGEEYNWPNLDGAPFDVENVRAGLMWLREVRDAEVDMLPRDFEPDSTQCRGCPFGGLDGGICWEGHVPGRDMRTVLYVENPDAGYWAQQLWDSREAQKPMKVDADRARGALMAVVDPGGITTKCGDHYLRLDSANRLKFVSGPKEVG